MKILIVHDDDRFVSKLSESLQSQRHQVVHFSSDVDPEDLLEFCQPQLGLFSLESTPVSIAQFERLARLASAAGLPVIACSTALDQSAGELISRYGTQFFLYKSTDLSILLKLIQGHQNRSGPPPRSLSDENETTIQLHPRSRAVFIGERRTELSRNEYNILEVLLKNANKLLSRTEILKLCEFSDEIDERNIDVHVFKLRKKLGAAGRTIRTVRSEGYILVRDENEALEREA